MRLAEISTESQSLADSSSAFVDVLLLSVTTATLKLDSDGFAVDESVASDDTDGFAVGQNVEEVVLPAPEAPIKAGQSTGTTEARDAVEEFAFAALDRYGVLDVFPGEWLGLYIELFC